MFYVLIIATITFFIAHVILLLTAFRQSKLARIRYFYSHLTLWITGIFVFSLALLYSGSGRSSFLDYFDSTSKKAMILVFTLSLSLVAHCIVTLAVVPLLRNK
ncbi:hypothetical protein [Pedobacter hartonius]|uniref:Uncharacterized protein n=1 Tax=Pedobacter hartonius TaxID=425514 RepID=A0A1H4E2V9_9SPHI|nr:hypothetical protein [Pedobacter hartonius]SEA79098.1 hypothetical protein SAMN05443550_105216 [Pedobacter hartonius]